MRRHPSRRRNTGARAGIALLLAIWLVTPATVPAQDATTPLRPMYGVDSTEFLLGAWLKPWQHYVRTDSTCYPSFVAPIRSPWQYLDWLGVTTMRLQADPWTGQQLIDTLFWRKQWERSHPDSATRANKIIASHLNAHFDGLPTDWWFDWWQLGYMTNVVLYPWDDVDQPTWPTKFYTIAGNVVTNEHDDDDESDDRPGVVSLERDLSIDNTSPGQIIARDVVFNWNANQVNRFKTPSVHDTTVQNTWWPLDYYNTRDFARDSIWFIVARLRLPQPQGAVPADSAILRIHLYWEHSATQITLCSTYVVRKADALQQNNALYVDVPFEVDFKRCGAGLGPLNDTSTSRRFNLAVEWAGNEKVALRSVSLRSRRAHWLLDSTTAEGQILYPGMRDHLRRVLYGPTGMADSMRPIIAVAAGIEHAPPEADTYAGMHRFLKRNFLLRAEPEARMPVWTEDGDHDALHRVDTSLDVYTSECGIGGAVWMRDVFGAGVEGVPHAIAEHNAGRFTEPAAPHQLIPELRLNRDSVESYERSLQRMSFGSHYAPSGLWQPYPMVPVSASTVYVNGVSFLTRLGRRAEQARDRNRRLIFVLFNTNAFGFAHHMDGSQIVLDTVITRIPEPAEMRAFTNVAIAYSATGLIHQITSGEINVLSTSPAPGVWTGVDDSFGFGPGIDDLQDYWDTMKVYSNGNPAYAGAHRYSVPRFYSGWGTRAQETRSINAWIRDGIGPELMRLRWRDGYSINYTVPQTWAVKRTWDTLVRYDSVGHRPIAAGEIFERITARKPGEVLEDLPEATYVEAGLFYPRADSVVVGYDTSRKTQVTVHHLFLVNRRCFEPPPHGWFPKAGMTPEQRADDSTLWCRRRDTMTQLAETREIAIRLNLPDSGQYRLVRVQEIAPDTTRLPGASAPRTGLDTVLYARGTVKITLGPGRGALLRITELPPTAGLRSADLRYNNQRKMLFDGRRYHAVYHRWNPADATGRLDSIFYIRSYPMADTLGMIYWEPVEYLVSSWRPAGVEQSTLANRHPSMTLRTRAGDTVITVVWSAENDSIHTWARRVLLRTIRSATGTAAADLNPTIETVATYTGDRAGTYGTPVVSRLEGGEMIAHSDSLAGMKARLRRLGSGSGWWFTNSGYTPAITLTPYPYTVLTGTFPSMPPFAHVDGRDSNVAIVWQQPYPSRTDILYKRLWHTPAGLAQTQALRLNATTGVFLHPSIDQIQDPWQTCAEVTAWEGYYWQPSCDTCSGTFNSGVYGRATYTDNRRTGGDSMGVPGYFYEMLLYVRNLEAPEAWPHVSTVQARDSGVAPERPQTVSVAFNGLDSPTDTSAYEVTAYYFSSEWDDLRTYAHGGRYLNGSASQDTGLAPGRSHAILYRTGAEPRPLLTTREFFLARRRPTGYRADGRRLTVSLNDSAGSQLTVTAHDAYMADDTRSLPLAFLPRPARDGRVDSLAQLRQLLRTTSFTGHDSTLVSLELGGAFAGDTLGWSGARLTVVADLVDSTSGTSVARLDSFRVSTTSASWQTIERVVDLVSGTYFVRVAIDTAGFVPVSTTTEEPWRLSVITEFVPSDLGKLRSLGRTEDSRLRISVQPNPAERTADIRFSLPTAGRVELRMTDAWGRDVRTLRSDAWLEPGRYSVPIDVTAMAPGAYIIEVTRGGESARCKLSVPAR